MGDENTGLDYNFDSYLTQVPEGLRDQIKPAFEQYSEGIKKSVTETYGNLDPFKELVEQGWQPEHVNVGLQLLQMAQEDPQRVVQGILQEHPELINQIPGLAPQPQVTPPVVPGQKPPSTDPDYSDLPPALLQRLDQQEQIIQLLAQGFQQNQQQSQQFTQQQQEQAELNQFKAELDKVAPENKYPRQFILSYVAQGQSPEEAVKSFTDWQASQTQLANGNRAPLIAPANGGGLPSETLDTSKLTPKQRVDLMTQYLETANQQKG